jgi:predicted MPP superfamily phosphohydrolase
MKLEIGYKHSFEVRHFELGLQLNSSLNVLFLSDFHFNDYTNTIVEALIKKIDELNPFIILLGGDYVDTSNGLLHLNNLLSGITPNRMVFAIAGNHDYFFGLSRINEVMIRNKVLWLEKDSIHFQIGEITVRIDGNRPVISEDKVDLAILLMHKPLNYTNYQNDYQLIFAGHLHGSQIVLWQNDKGLYPGKWFYKWNILQASINDCHYFISKGLGDTLPVRFNCKKDIIFVKLTNTQQRN